MKYARSVADGEPARGGTRGPVQTAASRVDADDDQVGSGLVNPTAAMNPGLVSDSTPAEWLAFICGTGQISTANCTAAGVTPINPTDLNTPSIAVSRATESLPYVVTRPGHQGRGNAGHL